MAVPPQTDQAFLREVDEELRRDQMLGFWRRWGVWVVVGVVAALVALAGFLWWQHYRGIAAETQGETFSAALDSLGQNREANAAKPLAELAADGSDGYKVLARFTQADILLGKQDLKGAAAKFAEVAADDSIVQPFRDLALVRQTAAEFDALKPELVIARLKPLAGEGSPWLGSAGEMVAIAYARSNQRAQAGQMYALIARSTEVPETIRQRAVQMAGIMGVDAIADGENGQR